MTNTHPPHRPDRIILSLEERRGVVLDVIRSARTRLSLSLFRCTDLEIFDALRTAVDRGVAVEVLVTSRAKGGRRKLERLWRRLQRTGATVHAYTDAVVKYHAKYVVADDGPALVASLNFTTKCFTRTCDAIVLTWDPVVVSSLRDLLAADRMSDLAPLLSPRLIVGPEGARRQFTGAIEQARTSILLIDAKLDDPGILSLLARKRAAGVTVQVHADRRVGSLKSHGKIMLIDGVRAIIGSLALTPLSLDFHREVAIETTSREAVAEIHALFGALGMTAAEGAVATAGDAT
jgi:cardiolipin synthase